MQNANGIRKKLKSPSMDMSPNITNKTSITCVHVPEALFDAAAAKKHFSKFGRVQKITLLPKRYMCIVEYDQPSSAEKAVLNAGAYDGFMFDVTRTKPRVRKRSKREDDPDWIPDSDVEEELLAMGSTPMYRITRQKQMDVDATEVVKTKSIERVAKRSPMRKTVAVREKKPSSQPVSGRESPMVMATQTSMSTPEAAAELHQLRFRVSLTPDEQWRTLDMRDKILRSWGGAGSRVKVGGATIGTCPDMCPEKELLHRQAEHQVMTLETVVDSDGVLEPWRAVKQYSRSSADQEMPMCYELRPPHVLMRTCAYLLHEIADTKRQVTLADWFHFMWDRLRSIRKDITQQALCCTESIYLVEMCARFHAHCAARLADLEHTQFDQKLNTDNLTKCLQTLKHMYADVKADKKQNEAEFRGYIALLNLGDANFWWEIKHLPQEIQKSEPISFAIEIFNALDNNNYVRFFRLVKEKATYLQACILLRYFNDVRARALARIVKAYAPRGGSRYPAVELMNNLAFESIKSMKSFVNHYGLRFAKDESELAVILDRNQFIEDMDPFPVARAVNLIESKRQCTVGEVIAGGPLPHFNKSMCIPYSSFNKDGKLKETALVAEDQKYNTINDSNKSIASLKTEIQKLSQSGKICGYLDKTVELKSDISMKSEPKFASTGSLFGSFATSDSDNNKSFSFNPAIPVAPVDIIKNSPDKMFNSDTKNIFSFSKPQETSLPSLLKQETGLFQAKIAPNNVFGSKMSEKVDAVPTPSNIFQKPETTNIFQKADSAKSLFGQSDDSIKNIFSKVSDKIFSGKLDPSIPVKDEQASKSGKSFFAKETSVDSKNIFAKAREEILESNNKDVKFVSGSNIFGKAETVQGVTPESSKVFGMFKPGTASNIFSKQENLETSVKTNSIFMTNGEASTVKLSPGSLFKSANAAENKGYTIFQSKNKGPSVADNIFNSANTLNAAVYDFDNKEAQSSNDVEKQRLDMEKEEQRLKQEREKEKKRELERKEQEQREEERRKEEEKRKQEEIRRAEEKRKKEEQKRQEELRKKLEEERKAELKRQAEEAERRFKEKVDKESSELITELSNEVCAETLNEILNEEIQKIKSLMSYADSVTEEVLNELCSEISESEIKAEKFWTEKLMKKWFYVWRKQFVRNYKRRTLLEDTPVWLVDKSPAEQAATFRRFVEGAALKNMNAFHRGYKFSGELPQLPSPENYNIMEIIKSPFLRRMKLIKYPYDKCFFWKLAIIKPDESKWLCRKIELHKWILDTFSDKKIHEFSETLIRVEKQSWNNLMDFAISVSMANYNNSSECSQAMEGTNGLLFYFTENNDRIIETIEQSVRHKYRYQLVPLAIVMPKNKCENFEAIEQVLNHYCNEGLINSYKIFILDAYNLFESLNTCTKSALKWLAKNYPEVPPLEVDNLKSLCQSFLGREIWYQLRRVRDNRMINVLKDLRKLVTCFNMAVDRLTLAITDEDLFNYPTFPLEFSQYLDHSLPYPKPYEFIPSNARNSSNIMAIKNFMLKLKLPVPGSEFHPVGVISMQDQIHKYCNQIGWFQNPEQVVCKVVASLPNEFTDLDMPYDEFNVLYKQYDLIDILNVIIGEKIAQLRDFNKLYVLYKKSELENYRHMHWIHGSEVLSKIKHRALEYEDDLDVYIEAKRRKVAADDSFELLMLEDNDCTMVDENIKATNESISKYSNCKDAVEQLELKIEEERKKSIELEKLLNAALCNY